MFIIACLLCVLGPFAFYALALLLASHHMLFVRGWVIALVFFSAFLVLSLVSLLYSVQHHRGPASGEAPP